MIFMLRPRSGPTQWVDSDKYRLSPSVAVSEAADSFGNLRQRLVAPVGKFEIFTSTHVVVDSTPHTPKGSSFVEVLDLPNNVLVYLLPSRYCESDRFGDMASEIVGESQIGYAQVEAITEWVRANVANNAGSSTYPVSAVEINERREGVCRDLAQISIALCRAMCIPARLVVGYMHALEPMDVHAWFEAFLDGRWHPFDPTVVETNSLRIAIAHGRDSADVAIYNQYGPMLLPDSMSVNVDVL